MDKKNSNPLTFYTHAFSRRFKMLMYLNFSTCFSLFFQTCGHHNSFSATPVSRRWKHLGFNLYFFQGMRTEIEKREEAIVEQTSVVESQCPPETSNIEVNEEEPPHEKEAINTVNYITFIIKCWNPYSQTHCFRMVADVRRYERAFVANSVESAV